MDYHRLFYPSIIKPLLSINGAEAVVDGYRFILAGDTRPQFRNNYQRDLFIATRDKLIVCGKDNNFVTILRMKGETAIVYREAIEFLFDSKATHALVELLKKYFTTEIRERDRNLEVDAGNGSYEERMYLYEIR